jgi:hypothetical protein
MVWFKRLENLLGRRLATLRVSLHDAHAEVRLFDFFLSPTGCYPQYCSLSGIALDFYPVGSRRGWARTVAYCVAGHLALHPAWHAAATTGDAQLGGDFR